MADTISKNNLVIGSMRKSEQGNGRTSWRFRVFYDEEDSLMYPVAKGVQATRWTGATDSYINNIDVETLEDGVTTFLDLEAVPYKFLDKDGSRGGQAADPDSPEKDIVQTYEMKSVFFPMEWFGVKEADSTDKILACKSVLTGNPVLKIGELVYKDPAQTAPDYTRCLYSGMPTAVAQQADRDKIIAMIECRRRVYVYLLTFFRLGSFSVAADFEGINPTGNFNGGTGADDALLNPFNVDAHKWKAIDQKLISFNIVKKRTAPRVGYVNTAYLRLQRIFERAPTGLTFKATEGGGEWTW